MIIAVTLSPAFKARLLTDSLVMIAEILLPFTSIITSAFTAPSFISLTTPLIWFVALSLMLSSFETITLEALNKR